MEKCECFWTDSWHEVRRYDGDCLPVVVKKNICNGTKEREECTCGGDPAKCDFYPQKRAEAKKKASEANGSKTTSVYYAHHQWKYGTKVEQYELEVISRYFPHANVFNPATDLLSTNCGDEKVIMEECLDTVANSDILVFSSMDGMIGIGVYTEVDAALKAGKLVLYLTKNTLTTEFTIRAEDERTRNDLGVDADRLYATVWEN